MGRPEAVKSLRQSKRKPQRAKWPCPGGRVLGEAVFPVLPRSWNEILALSTRERMSARRGDKMRWWALLMSDEGRRLPQCVKGVEIHVSCVGPGRRDPDNLVVKPLIDAMRAATILSDDDSDHVSAVRLEYRKIRGVGKATCVRLVEAEPVRETEA